MIFLCVCALFQKAMHLVYKVLDNYPLPVSLPLELLPPDVQTRRGSTLAGAVNVLPAQITPPQVVPVEAIKVRRSSMIK